jgi:enoyl-CoA hydratase
VSNPIKKQEASPGHLQLRIEGAIATLTICHSARRNAMTRAMWRQLQGIGEQLPAQVRCLIVRGLGDHFCAGGDISEYPSFRFTPESLAHFHEEEVALGLEALLALDTPIIAMIAGYCMGGGLEIACCADIRIASETATFGAPIAKLGMPMAPRELELVLRVAGETTVREMLLEARVLSASEMSARGYVQRVVSNDDLENETNESAQRICSLSPQAARLNKQAIRQFSKKNQSFADTEYTQGAINSVARNRVYEYAASSEHVEGISAFLQKRQPNF